MAMTIIIKDDDGKQVETTLDFDEHHDRDWEEVCYQLGCAVAREVAIRWLKVIEEGLFQKRSKNWEIEGFRKRIRVTRFGKFNIWRRLYNDEKGKSHFLLDEYLNWLPRKRATPSLRKALAEMSTKATFREVSKTMEKLLAGVLSHSTIHRVLQEVAEAAIQSERREWEDCFEGGTLSLPGEQKTPVLYTEADGLCVHLQREEKQKHYELKNAIAYEGWERLPQKEERYRLVNKKVYCHGDASIPFWDGVGLAWHKQWDLGSVELIVLGGDDANWIDKGIDELAFSIRQLSGFHLARSCRRGWKNGKEIYDAIRSGAIWIGEAQERSGKSAQKARKYVIERLEKGKDWRKKVEGTALASRVPEGARGLGAMEGNQANLFADRMKDRGMSWTTYGARHMGKAIQLAFNGDLKQWCGPDPSDSEEQEKRLSFDLFEDNTSFEKRASLPALEGPHASRPWVRVLRNLTMPSHRLK